MTVKINSLMTVKRKYALQKEIKIILSDQYEMLLFARCGFHYDIDARYPHG